MDVQTIEAMIKNGEMTEENRATMMVDLKNAIATNKKRINRMQELYVKLHATESDISYHQKELGYLKKIKRNIEREVLQIA